MKKESTNIIARLLVLGYVGIAICAVALILATPTRTSAIEAPPVENEPSNALLAPDLPIPSEEPIKDTVEDWCGVNKGVKFNTGAVGTHTQGPIEIVISTGSPTAVTSVDTNSESVIPYKIVVNGGGSDSEDYVWPATVKNMTAPIENDDELPPNVSFVIVCYLEKRNSDDQNDDTDNGGGTTSDDDHGDVLGASTETENSEVLGAETLAETGASAAVAVGTGVSMIITGFMLSRISSRSTYKA